MFVAHALLRWRSGRAAGGGARAARCAAAAPCAPAAAAANSAFVGGAARGARRGAGGARRAPRLAGLRANVSSNDFRNGMTIELDKTPFKVVEFLHVKPGKGAAFVRSKLRNMITGNTVERTFRAGETVPQAELDKVAMQHTYMDGEDFVFMNMESFEEERLSAKQIGDQAKFMRENLEVQVLKWQDTVLDVELPSSMVLEVVETEPGVRGNTAQGGSKPAKLETGAVVQVPLFIDAGERIKVDTRECKYMSRA